MTHSICWTMIASPVGPLVAEADDRALLALRFDNEAAARPARGERGDDQPLLAQLRAELARYFAGERFAFGVPLAPEGTAFQRIVWSALEAIPYGSTESYRALAGRIGRPAAVRAVGAANGRNPIPILIPCHRVIGANGTLVGYAGGLERKKILLAIESVRLPQGDPLQRPLALA